MESIQHITSYGDIDWQQLWEQSRSRRSWESKGADGWDQKASSYASRIRESAFAERFLGLLELDETMSVLDVGCGPGTLAIPLAAKVAGVTAIDYSRTMLELLELQAAQSGITNIRTVHCAWEDDWSRRAIGTYDIVIASRSMNIENLAGALHKLIRHSRGHIHIAERIDPSPFDADAFAAIGRPFESGPDYIYTLNMLYKLGVHPRIDHIELDRELRFASMEQALNGYRWMFKDLQPGEERMLETYLESRTIRSGRDGIVIRRDPPQRWALLSWTGGKR